MLTTVSTESDSSLETAPEGLLPQAIARLHTHNAMISFFGLNRHLEQVQRVKSAPQLQARGRHSSW
jgi:hypothetical protein